MRAILLAATAAIVAAPASAAVVDFSNIRATWFDAVGGTDVTYINNGTANAKVRWGVDQGNGQSGYDFRAAAIPQLTVNPPAGTSEGTIGTFTHRNVTIGSNSAITSIKLEFLTDVLVDGVQYLDVPFIYQFTHWETSNEARPCADGGTNGVGINAEGCADRVTANFNRLSDGFTITEDGVDYIYALDVAGFLVDGDPMEEFWTRESANNKAYLRGKVVLYSEAAAVPEPASWAMLIAGFGMIGLASRRRKGRVPTRTA